MDWCEAHIDGTCTRVSAGALLGIDKATRFCVPCLAALNTERDPEASWLQEVTGVELWSVGPDALEFQGLWMPDVVLQRWAYRLQPWMLERDVCEVQRPGCAQWASGCLRGPEDDTLARLCRPCLASLLKRDVDHVPETRLRPVKIAEGPECVHLAVWVPDDVLLQMRVARAIEVRQARDAELRTPLTRA